MKRFWKRVSVDADRVVMLDARAVRTPGRAPLALPTDALAALVAEEWRDVGETIDPRAMPLTGLVNAAIDRVAADRAAFAAGLAKYGETDLLYYRAEAPEPLAERQRAAWDPWLDWARHRYDIYLEPTTGVMHHAQPVATIARLEQAVGALDGYTLTALSPLVTLTGSLILGLALVERAVDPDTAWAAAHVDEDWQAELWGQDALATEARADKRRDFDAAVRFLEAL